jgi:hypothetical protein
LLSESNVELQLNCSAQGIIIEIDCWDKLIGFFQIYYTSQIIKRAPYIMHKVPRLVDCDAIVTYVSVNFD